MVGAALAVAAGANPGLVDGNGWGFLRRAGGRDVDYGSSLVSAARPWVAPGPLSRRLSMAQKVHTLVPSTNGGRYALDDGATGADMSSGQSLDILVGGRW